MGTSPTHRRAASRPPAGPDREAVVPVAGAIGSSSWRSSVGVPRQPWSGRGWPGTAAADAGDEARRRPGAAAGSTTPADARAPREPGPGRRRACARRDLRLPQRAGGRRRSRAGPGAGAVRSGPPSRPCRRVRPGRPGDPVRAVAADRVQALGWCAPVDRPGPAAAQRARWRSGPAARRRPPSSCRRLGGSSRRTRRARRAVGPAGRPRGGAGGPPWAPGRYVIRLATASGPYDRWLGIEIEDMPPRAARLRGSAHPGASASPARARRPREPRPARARRPSARGGSREISNAARAMHDRAHRRDPEAVGPGRAAGPRASADTPRRAQHEARRARPRRGSRTRARGRARRGRGPIAYGSATGRAWPAADSSTAIALGLARTAVITTGGRLAGLAAHRVPRQEAADDQDERADEGEPPAAAHGPRVHHSAAAA